METESDSSRSGFSPDAAFADSFSLPHGTNVDAAPGHAFAKKVN